MFFVKLGWITVGWITLIAFLISNCSAVPLSDQTGPTIQNITPSSKVVAKSDCIPTSLTITADIADRSGVQSAVLWFRVGDDQSFAPVDMTPAAQGQYSATVKGLDVPGGEYGVFEFYIVANDKAGNQTKSSTDKSVQLLPCVG